MPWMRIGGRGLATALLALFAALAAARVGLRPYVNPDRVEGDLGQHVWWTQRFEDPALFPGDPLAEFMARPLFAPLGWQAVYRALAPALGAEGVSRLLPFLLAGPTLLLAFLAGRAAARGRAVGGVVALVVFALLRGGLDATAWGLPRSFAPTLLLFGTWALLARRTAAYGASLLAASLFYPPVVVNLGLLGALVLGVDVVRARALPKGWPAAAVLGAGAVAVLLAVYAAPLPEGVGPKVSVEVARTMPEFQPGGRSQFFSDDPARYWLDSHRSGLGLAPLELLAALALTVAAELALRRRTRPPLPVYGLLATSLAAFLLAHATLFALHLPNRYVATTIPVFAALLCASVAGRVAEGLAARGRTPGPRARRAALAAGAVAVLGYAAFVATGAAAYAREGRKDDRAAAHAFLRTLPVDARVAAHPADADLVPLRSARSVLASQETSLPYWLGHYARVRERVRASLEMTYAASWEELDAAADRAGVDVFLVRRTRYAREAWGYPPPFRQVAERLAARAAAAGFPLLSPPPERRLFEAGDYAVLRVGAARPPR
jgi:hypothetical protein